MLAGGDAYVLYLDSGNSLNVVAVATNGSPVTISGVSANLSRVVVTVVDVGDVAVVRAADDAESAAGIIIAGREEVLGKFQFTATNEEMMVNKMQVLVTNQGSATAFTNAAVDEVWAIKLYDGATQIGSAAGYPVMGSGASAGVAFIDGLNWKIPKDGSKTLAIKGVLNTIAQGADSGASVYAVLLDSGFEAQGATAKDTSIQSVIGNEKRVYKTKPIVTLLSQPGGKLSAGETSVLRFRVAADSGESISWKKITLRVSMTGATMVAPDAVPGTTGNVKVKELTSTNSNLNIANVSGGPIPGGASGFVPIVLANEERISAGAYKDYEVSLTFMNLSPTVGAAYASVQLSLQETEGMGGAAFSAVQASNASFIWSDNSSVSHSETTLDWANGRYVKELPSQAKTVVSQAGSSFVFRFASLLKSVLWVLGN
ncbi:MAG: hypothetical protein Q8P01_02330 [bacterium]|nr:hypothetical protein [bacterium]